MTENIASSPVEAMSENANGGHETDAGGNDEVQNEGISVVEVLQNLLTLHPTEMIYIKSTSLFLNVVLAPKPTLIMRMQFMPPDPSYC